MSKRWRPRSPNSAGLHLYNIFLFSVCAASVLTVFALIFALLLFLCSVSLLFSFRLSLLLFLSLLYLLLLSFRYCLVFVCHYYWFYHCYTYCCYHFVIVSFSFVIIIVIVLSLFLSLLLFLLFLLFTITKKTLLRCCFGSDCVLFTLVGSAGFTLFDYALKSYNFFYQNIFLF